MKSIRIEDLTWKEIKNAIERGYQSVVFTLGSTEQHGPALPEKTDTTQGEYIANSLAKKLTYTLQAPTISTGCSEHHMSFPGTITLRKKTLQMIIEDYVSSLTQHGFRNIIIIPFHGGNFGPLKEILSNLQQQNSGANIITFTELPEFINLIESMCVEAGLTSEEAGGHADVWESSNMLFLDEEHVKPNDFMKGYTGKIGKEEIDLIFSKGMTVLTENGILGDSRRAARAYGKVFLEKTVDFFFEQVKNQIK